jgi:hypothetical protein
MSSADQREEVQRILQSAQFRRAPKLQRFLELVCDYHFQGRSAEINEWLEFGPLPNACVAPVRRVPSLRSVWMILAGTVLACLAVLVAADHERRLLIQTASAAGRSTALSAPIAGLWNRFLDSDVPTLLVVSNPDVGECAETGRHWLPGRIYRDGRSGCDPPDYRPLPAGEANADRET